MVLTIAFGIVLGFLILGALPYIFGMVFSKGFWKFIGYVAAAIFLIYSFATGQLHLSGFWVTAFGILLVLAIIGYFLPDPKNISQKPLKPNPNGAHTVIQDLGNGSMSVTKHYPPKNQ